MISNGSVNVYGIDLILRIIETEYSGFIGQYQACWCPGDFISRHDIDRIRLTTSWLVPLQIWSIYVEQIPRYDDKSENIVCILQTIQRVKS